MSIETTKAEYSARISEDSLEDIIKFYWEHKLNQKINIKKQNM